MVERTDTPETGREDYYALISKVLENRKKVKTASHKGWDLTCYVGRRPSFENDNVTFIEYSVYATAGDIGKSQTPDMSNVPRAIRVDFDDSSVVTLNAESMEEITGKLQKIFNGFRWDLV